MMIDGYDYISERAFTEDWMAHAKPSGDLFFFDEISAFPLEHVWTVLADEGVHEDETEDASNWYASPGVHLVNALGYVVTEKPWQTDTSDAIWFLADTSA